MSFANYLQQDPTDKIASFTQVYLRSNPNDIDDGARIADSIRYVGNATYPAGTQTTIQDTDTGYVPLFFTDVSEEDYLRVKTGGTDNTNFPQLANVEYKIRVKGNSMDRFWVRFATYDASLNVIDEYDPVEYNPPVFTHQTYTLSTLNLRGFSVDYSEDAVYGFMEISGDGVGSLLAEFDYANSDLQNSLDTSRETGQVGARQTTNLWYVDLDDLIIDASGIEAQIQALQADVADLQADQTATDTSLNNLTADKYDKAGGEITGDISLNGALNMDGRLQVNFLGENQVRGNLEIVADQGGGGGSAWRMTALPNLSFLQSDGEMRFSDWADSGFRARLLQNGNFQIAGGYSQSGSQPSTLTGLLTADGGIDMNNKTLVNVPTPSNGGDAVNKTYADTKLPLAGGTMTGNLSMGGSRITNIGAPVQASDVASKGYVDSNAGDANLQQVLARGSNAGGGSISNLNTLSATGNIATSNQIFANSGTITNSLGVATFSASATSTLTDLYALTLRMPISYRQVAGNTTITLTPTSDQMNVIYINSGGDCVVDFTGSYKNGHLFYIRNDSNAGAPTIRFKFNGSQIFNGEGIGGQNATGQRWVLVAYIAVSRWVVVASGSDGWTDNR